MTKNNNIMLEWPWVVSKMRNYGIRNAESKMRNLKCGMTLIVEASNHVTAVIRILQHDYRNDITTGRAVKCRPAMRKMQAIKQEYVVDRAHTLQKHSANVFTPQR